MSDPETTAETDLAAPPEPVVVPMTYTAPVVAALVTATITPAAALDQWVDTHIRNSAYSQDTGCWNRIHNAVVAIKDALATADSKEA